MGVSGSVFISQPKETRITFPKLVISKMKKTTLLYSDTGAVCIKFLLIFQSGTNMDGGAHFFISLNLRGRLDFLIQHPTASHS